MLFCVLFMPNHKKAFDLSIKGFCFILTRSTIFQLLKYPTKILGRRKTTHIGYLRYYNSPNPIIVWPASPAYPLLNQ